MAEVDIVAVAYDLEDLHFKIEAVRAELIDGDVDDDEEEILRDACEGDKPGPGESSDGSEKITRFSQLRSKFRFKAFKRKPSTSAGVRSPASPFSDDDTGSITSSLASDLTLVPSLLHSQIPTKHDVDYLNLLAPLVASLQHIGPLLQIANDPKLRMDFLKRCDELSDLLKELKKETLFSPSPAAMDDDDMRLLLFTALHKKVLLERTKCAKSQTGPVTTPLIPPTPIINPFILHSSSLSDHSSLIPRLTPRTPSPPKPIAPIVKLQEGSFSDFMGHSQQTWRMNVHRLGSFQASALFSPSPIAVNKALRLGAGR